jgi:hypothetical protein
MREIRTSGSEGGGAGNSTGPSYPYQKNEEADLKRSAPSTHADVQFSHNLH